MFHGHYTHTKPQILFLISEMRRPRYMKDIVQRRFTRTKRLSRYEVVEHFRVEITVLRWDV